MFTWSAHPAPRILMVVLAACTPVRLQAQDRAVPEIPIRFERLDGLSHNTVFSILQDRQGFLWIGTSDGLNRYDGYEFVFYRHDPGDTTSLSNNTVRALLEDRSGNLWVGTDDGLHRLDRRRERFVRYGLRPGRAASSRQVVFQLLEDHAGRLWVATNGGLYRYDRPADGFKVYRHDPGDPNSLANDGIWSLYEGRDRTLWVGNYGSVLHRYDPEADHFARFTVPQAWSFITIHYEDKTGRLWLSDHEVKVSAFERASGRFTALPEVPSGHLLQAVREDRNGICWIGTNDGLYRYDPATNERLHLRTDASPGAHLQNNIKTLYEDRAGTLWVGTFSGLYRLDPRTKPFAHLGHDPTDANSLSGNTVMAVLEDKDGVLWVGTLGGGLNRVERRMGTITRYQHRPDDPTSLCSDLIWSLYQDRRGTLWIGTDEGLCALDPDTSGRFTSYALPVDSTETAQPPVNAVREDQKGRIWIASNIGLYRLDPLTGAVKWYDRPGDHPGRLSPNFFVQSLHLDRAGSLWISTFGGDLHRLNPETDTFTRYPLMLTENNELVSEGIWAIHEDRGGTLWLGSDLGLTRFDPHSGALRVFTRHDGLPGSIVYAILEDDVLGRLWLSTNQGLVRFDEHLPGGQKVRVYDAGDGLTNTEFNRRAGFKGADGTFYFGGLGGLTWFHPAALQDNLVVPPVAITRIEVSNRDTTVTVNPYGLEQLVLSYRDHTIAFEFTALNFTNPSKNRYRYRLEGIDADWVEAGPRRFARYTNVPPGTYVFRVTGSNNDGYWNEEGEALRLRITPPFWQTWWFRLLVAASVVGLLAAAYRYRVARLIEIERMRLRIAGDLHDDIGSNLSSIALLSDIVRGREHLGERERGQLSKISHSARTMVETLRDIVWSIDPKSDRTDDLIQRMQDTAVALLGGTPFTFLKPVDGIFGAWDMDVQRHVLLSYKEMLHNIARHAQATAVSIWLEDRKGSLVLTVSDDGVGFDTSSVRKGTGLKHLRERVARIGGTLLVESTPGKGTTIRLVIPTGYTARKRRERVMRERPPDRTL